MDGALVFYILIGTTIAINAAMRFVFMKQKYTFFKKISREAQIKQLQRTRQSFKISIFTLVLFIAFAVMALMRSAYFSLAKEIGLGVLVFLQALITYSYHKEIKSYSDIVNKTQN